MKKILIVVFVVFVAGMFWAMQQKMQGKTKNETKNSVTGDTQTLQTRVFTLEELSKYNGKNGMPVYNAVDGIVYDFSNVGPWKTGKHMGIHTGGSDLSEAFNKKAPPFHRQKKVLDKLPRVGILKQTQGETK